MTQYQRCQTATTHWMGSCVAKKFRYHGYEASDELEVLEVIRVDVGGRIDLQTVVVLASVFKQTVHGVQNLMREQEEPFPEKYNHRTHNT